MTRRDENSIAIPARGNRLRSIGAITAITPGASFIQNIRIEFPYGTSIFVNAVPAGERFGILVDYSCINGAGTVIDPWSMCIVWWDDSGLGAIDVMGAFWRDSQNNITEIGDNMARIDHHGGNPGGDHPHSGSWDLANDTNLQGGQIMPNHNVVLKFNMFAHNDMTPATYYPATGSWGNTR